MSNDKQGGGDLLGWILLPIMLGAVIFIIAYSWWPSEPKKRSGVPTATIVQML